MVDQNQDRSVISSSGIGLWIVGAIAILLVIGLIWGAWRVWNAARSAVTKEVTPVVETTQPVEKTLRFVRTPTQIIVIDDPIIPEGETALEDVFDQTDEYLGTDVIISGTVTKYESSAFFTIKQDEDAVAVIALPEVIELNDLENVTAGKDTPVRISGKVKILTREIEKKGFGLELKNIDEAFWQDQLVIEAVKIEKLPGTTI